MLDNSKMLSIGFALVFMFPVYSAVRVSELLAARDEDGPRFELMVAANCGVPLLEFMIDENSGSATAALLLDRMQRVSGETCERVVIGAAHSITNAVWRENLFSNRETVPLEVTDRGYSAFKLGVIDLTLPQPGGVVEFTLPNSLVSLSYDRFQFNISFGHFPATGMSRETRDFFIQNHTNLLRIGVNVPLDFSLESAFPAENGGRVSTRSKGYLFEVPYVYAPANVSADHETSSSIDYYQQTDLSASFISHSRSQDLSYLVLFWSTMMGVGIGLLVDILLRLVAWTPLSGKNPDT